MIAYGPGSVPGLMKWKIQVFEADATVYRASMHRMFPRKDEVLGLELYGDTRVRFLLLRFLLRNVDPQYRPNAMIEYMTRECENTASAFVNRRIFHPSASRIGKRSAICSGERHILVFGR